MTAWNRQADRERSAINWRFRVSDARRVFRYAGITTPRSEHQQDRDLLRRLQIRDRVDAQHAR